ncbi:MAG: SRPBCC family protein [Streptosporangiaceae bacterium]
MTSEHADGALSAGNGNYVLRFERQLRHPANQVWDALTEPDALTHWFPHVVDGDMSLGGKLRFSFPAGGDYESLPGFEGEVLEYDPPRLLEYSWGPDTLRWELVPDGEGCLLIFTDTISEQGKAARDGAGWHVCLDALAASLDGMAPPPKERWQQVHAEYVASFGPAASTMGPPSPEAG